MPRTRRRNFVLTAQEVLQLLDADDSDEEGLMEVDEDDAALLHDNAPEMPDEVVELGIDDAGTDEPPIVHAPSEGNMTFRWSKRCPSLNIPDPIQGLGELRITFSAISFPTPAEIFKSVSRFASLLSDILVPESILYMQQKGNPFSIDEEELQAFIGIIFVMSYHRLPDMKLYWSVDPDVRVSVIADVMTRSRFFEIKRALHFSNNEEALDKNDTAHDRAWKVRPLINHFNDAFQAALSPTAEQSIDERMVKFKGQSMMKQYMKDKPIQRGFKHWCRNDSKTGYVFEIDLYTGKSPGKSPEVGLSEAVVLQLTRQITGCNIHLYIDNFYTSPNLLIKLKDDAIFCTGTVRQNRKGMPKDFVTDKSMNRGDIDARHCDGMFAVKWMDNKAVHLLSTITSSNKVITVRRGQKGHPEKVNVPCPAMIQEYNNGMNGTDVMDQRTKPYSFDRRSPAKYYTRPFFDYLEMAVVNSFIIQEKLAESEWAADRPKTLLDFKRRVALDLIGSYTSRNRFATSRSGKKTPLFHRVAMIDTKARCKNCYSQGKKDVKVFTKCETCEVHLCISKTKDCFNHYHDALQCMNYCYTVTGYFYPKNYNFISWKFSFVP